MKSTESVIKRQVINVPEYEWFFMTFKSKERNEIFEIIYNCLFIKIGSLKMPNSPEKLEDYIIAKDNMYVNKSNEEIITLFNLKKTELNKSLEKYKIKLTIKFMYSLYLEDNEKKNYFMISCLRKIRFDNIYEWICNPNYLLYFQYFVLEYDKPIVIKSIDKKNEEKEKNTIDSISKANELLKNENFICIMDGGIKNIDFNELFEEGKKEFDLSKENIFEYLDYNNRDPKQIVDSQYIFNNNYIDIINFSFESHFTNLIYSFQNGNYFFEFNLINCLNNFQINRYRYFYLNINKINKIFNNKYLFKKYLGYWMSKLFQDIQKRNSEEKDDKNIDNKSNYLNFINELIDFIFKDKEKYLEIILNQLNNKFPKPYIKGADNRFNFRDNILVILNNINVSDVQWIEKMNFSNLHILFIFNIENNFDTFQFYYYEHYKLKKIFSENQDEIIYKAPIEENINKNFYSIFQSKDEYENTKKELINQILKCFKNKVDKLLNVVYILNSSKLIEQIKKEDDSFTKLKIDLGISSVLNILKPFCPIINFDVTVKDHSKFNIDDIKFKEKIFCDFLKEIYKSTMVNYLNNNSNELDLNDMKGPSLEKDIISSILTGQINAKKYNDFLNLHFKEIKVPSIYCLNEIELSDYEDNKNSNVIITQESKTAELYDFAFKINKEDKNHMKLVQISIFKDMDDLQRLNKESIILDIINFELNKEKLNLGKIDSYSFVIITSINVFNDYKNLKDKKKKINHTFFKMKEHCRKNNFEFYIYDYFENNMYIYNEDNDDVEKFNKFFENINKIDLYDKESDLYKFINCSKKKLSLKLTKKNLLYPIENYYQANTNKKISIINLAKYEFNPCMIKMFTGINNIGIAFWNYSDNKEFKNLIINLNNKSECFEGKKIIENAPNIFSDLDNKAIHTLLFSLKEEENNIDATKKEFLQKKRENKDLYNGNFSELGDNNSKRKKVN